MPLSASAPNTTDVEHKLSFNHVLRGFASSGLRLVVEHDAGAHIGSVCAVYADHFDLESGGVQGVDQRDRTPATVLSLPVMGVRKISIHRDLWV